MERAAAYAGSSLSDFVVTRALAAAHAHTRAHFAHRMRPRACPPRRPTAVRPRPMPPHGRPSSGWASPQPPCSTSVTSIRS
ncbi:MAG: DUF1778 domain-containing protein [Geminicoccaceae bacterium]